MDCCHNGGDHITGNALFHLRSGSSCGLLHGCSGLYSGSLGGIDEGSGLYLCRTTGDAPEVDGNVCVSSEEPLYPGQFYDVLVDDSDLYDLYGTVAK